MSKKFIMKNSHSKSAFYESYIVDSEKIVSRYESLVKYPKKNSFKEFKFQFSIVAIFKQKKSLISLIERCFLTTYNLICGLEIHPN